MKRHLTDPTRIACDNWSVGVVAFLQKQPVLCRLVTEKARRNRVIAAACARVISLTTLAPILRVSPLAPALFL
jgi:hypothetical protein